MFAPLVRGHAVVFAEVVAEVGDVFVKEAAGNLARIDAGHEQRLALLHAHLVEPFLGCAAVHLSPARAQGARFQPELLGEVFHTVTRPEGESRPVEFGD